MHALLKVGTAAQHAALDRGLGSLSSRDLSWARYRHTLAALYGLHAPLEVALREGFGPLPAPPISPPWRAPQLERDLRRLGLTRRQVWRLPRCALPPGLLAAEPRAGCLYVLEGSALGGRAVAAAVRRSLGLGPSTGAGFFAGPRLLARRWQALLAWLERLPGLGVEPMRVLAGAQATFGLFSRWLAEQGVLR